MPDLPTTAECGLPDVLVSTVNPVALPAGVPPDVVNTLAEATRRIMADQKLQADLRALAPPILRHRVITNFYAESEHVDADGIVTRLLDAVPGPKSGLET